MTCDGRRAVNVVHAPRACYNLLLLLFITVYYTSATRNIAGSIHTRKMSAVRPELRWLGSRVISVLDSGAVQPGFKLQPRRCWVTVLGKLFTPIVPRGVVVRERSGTPFRQIFWSRNGAPANIVGHRWNSNTEAFRHITS